ncbi:MAG: hypothetical protein K2N80_05405 [Lachnospiraceae bacterium]|nr:hypothetical protein [Lachnospiraceae bacterium]
MKLHKGIIEVILANIINLIISIGNGFFLPKYLSIESYADVKTFLLYISYVGVLHFGYVDGVYIKYGGKLIQEISTEELAYEKKVLALFQIVITLPILLIACFDRDFNLLCASFSVLPINMVSYFKFIYQATGEFKKYRYITNLSTILVFVFNLIFLFIIKTDFSLWYIGTHVLVSFTICCFYEWRNKCGSIRNKITLKGICIRLKENINLGIVIMLGNFMGMWITSIDRWFVKFSFNVAEFAYYSFAVTMLRFINVVVTAFSITLYSFFCKEPEKEDVVRLRRMVLVIGAVIIAAIFPIDLIIQIYLKKYIYAIPVIRILFLTQFILIEVNAIYLNLYKANNLQKKYLIHMLVITVFAFISNLVIGYLWRNNIAAYSLATFLTSLVWLILCQADLPQYKMSKREWIYILLTVTAYFVCNCFNAWMGMALYVGWIIIETTILFLKDIRLLFGMMKSKKE